MPKSFSQEERIIIQQNLLTAGGECIRQYGMQKTTIDELVKRCHIAKGSFYHFYASKELLFWDVIMQWHEEIHAVLEQKCLSLQDENMNTDSLTDLIFDCYMKCFEIGLGPILLSDEMNYLIRKLPPEVIANHSKQDTDLLTGIITLLPNSEHVDTTLYSGAFEGIFMMLLYRKELGEQFPDILRLTIRGVVIQLLGGRL